MRCLRFFFFLSVIFLLSTILTGTIIEIVKTPCPICRNEVKYRQWISTYGSYSPDVHYPFMLLDQRPGFFHCHRCGFTLYVNLYDKLFPENKEPELNQETLSEIKASLERSRLVNELKPPRETPVSLQFELMEAVLPNIPADLFLDITDEGTDWDEFYSSLKFYRDFYSHKSYSYYIEGKEGWASSDAFKAIRLYSLSPDSEPWNPDYDRKEYLIRISPLHYFNGNSHAALTGYLKAIQIHLGTSDKSVGRAEKPYDNSIAKDVLHILNNEDQLSLKNRLKGWLILLLYVLKLNLSRTLWMVFFLMAAAWIGWVLIKKTARKPEGRIRLFLFILYMLAVPALFLWVSERLLYDASYITFLFIALIWALLIIGIEKLGRSRNDFSGIISSRPWYFLRAVLVFSPAAIGLFKWGFNFQWLPIFFPEPSFAYWTLFYQRDSDFEAVFFILLGILVMMALFSWLVMILYQGYRRKAGRFPQLKKRLIVRFAVIVFALSLVFISAGSVGVVGFIIRFATTESAIFYLTVGLVWSCLLWLFERFLVRDSTSGKSFPGRFRVLISRRTWIWIKLIALVLPLVLWKTAGFMPESFAENIQYLFGWH